MSLAPLQRLERARTELMLSSYYETLDTRGKDWCKEKLEAVGLLDQQWPLFAQAHQEILLWHVPSSMDTKFIFRPGTSFQNAHARTVLCMTLSVDTQVAFCWRQKSTPPKKDPIMPMKQGWYPGRLSAFPLVKVIDSTILAWPFWRFLSASTRVVFSSVSPWPGDKVGKYTQP